MADIIDELIENVEERKKYVDEIVEMHFNGKTEFSDDDIQKFIKISNKKFNLDSNIITFEDVKQKKGDEGDKYVSISYDNLLDVSKYLLLATKDQIDLNQL